MIEILKWSWSRLLPEHDPRYLHKYRGTGPNFYVFVNHSLGT